MDLISRRNERAQNDYLKEMGRLNFERRRELLFLFINLMRQLDILRYMWILYIECIAFIQAYDYLNLSVQCEQKFGSPVRQNLKQVNVWETLTESSIFYMGVYVSHKVRGWGGGRGWGKLGQSICPIVW